PTLAPRALEWDVVPAISPDPRVLRLGRDRLALGELDYLGLLGALRRPEQDRRYQCRRQADRRPDLEGDRKAVGQGLRAADAGGHVRARRRERAEQRQSERSA